MVFALSTRTWNEHKGFLVGYGVDYRTDAAVSDYKRRLLKILQYLHEVEILKPLYVRGGIVDKTYLSYHFLLQINCDLIDLAYEPVKLYALN